MPPPSPPFRPWYEFWPRDAREKRTVVFGHWARNGLVYTGVSDAPSDVFADMVDALADSGRSAPESIVDYVLGPFGWT